MAKKTQKTSFAQSLKNHRSDKTETPNNNGELPAGIEGGVAELTGCKIGEFKQGQFEGEQYFSATGTVISPQTHDGMHVQGMMTRIMITLCDTPNRKRKTSDENVAWMLNELRLLGGDECTEHVENEEDLEQLLEALISSGIKFRFRTWSGASQELEERSNGVYVVQGNRDVAGPYKDEESARKANRFVGQKPNVNHVWMGAVNGEVDTPTDNYTTDNTKETQSEETQNEVEDDLPFDVDALVERAEQEDEEAMDLLDNKGRELGITQKQLDEEEWGTIGNMIKERMNGEENQEENQEDEGEDPPEKGDSCYHKPKGKRKKIECEVTAVFPGRETCNLKGPDGTIYKSVSWDDLIYD